MTLCVIDEDYIEKSASHFNDRENIFFGDSFPGIAK